MTNLKIFRTPIIIVKAFNSIVIKSLFEKSESAVIAREKTAPGWLFSQDIMRYKRRYNAIGI
ncbi:hypothetical protein [Methanolacinia petrolearia]|uniref:hypothetical protein n=1 Tax=Methanolacinia petrolearia TaxID=54120 RepID=UPI003BABF964